MVKIAIEINMDPVMDPEYSPDPGMYEYAVKELQTDVWEITEAFFNSQSEFVVTMVKEDTR